MTRVALRTLFGTAFSEAAGIGSIFWDIRKGISGFQDGKVLILDDKSVILPKF